MRVGMSCLCCERYLMCRHIVGDMNVCRCVLTCVGVSSMMFHACG